MTENKKIREGDLYEVIEVSGREFEIRYGYYDEKEREHWEPEPIFPDLKNNPVYTDDGYMIVTQMQDICDEFKLKDGFENNEICAECTYFVNEDKKMIGICTKQRNGGEPYENRQQNL